MKKTILSIAAGTILSVSAFAQIPNGGFENWTSMGAYSNPDSWDQLNAMTSTMSVYTCTKGTPGSPGTSYIKLVSKNVTGMGVMPGIATTGMINMSTMNVTGGFASTQRPQSLTGSWQHMASGNDAGMVAIYLTKWDNAMMMRDTVAMAMQSLTSMQMSWANFTIPLMYMSGGMPDTAQIILSSSGMTPVANSYLYVDNLAFTGSVAGIKENKFIADVKLFPNPAIDKLVINLSNTKIVGGKVKSVGETDFSSNYTLDIADLAKGQYIIKLTSVDGIITRKFLKQ
jgi:hypothetical protein